VTRIRAMLGKELLDLRLNPWVLIPGVIGGAAALLLPFVIAVVVPRVSGETLTESGELQMAVDMMRAQPGGSALDPETAIQAWIFQQFLMFLILVPVISATSTAAHSVVGEKQARTLEPLLATPITTFELLAAKALAALLPALALTVICFVIDIAATAVFARPGVATVLLGPRSLALVFLLGPLAVLAALQVAVCVSSRVEDERTAQAVGSFVAMPVAVLFVAPLLGLQTMTMAVILGVAAVLAIANALLMRLSIAVFDRESILTRWK
jgi:ABC-2 type transport system permease protein